eukprot:359060-Chlamydomonas_euryale.AAC.14
MEYVAYGRVGRKASASASVEGVKDEWDPAVLYAGAATMCAHGTPDGHTKDILCLAWLASKGEGRARTRFQAPHKQAS